MIRDRIRNGLERIGNSILTRATDIAPLAQWLGGYDVDDYALDYSPKRMTDPYTQSVFCFRCVSGAGQMLGKVPWELVDVESDDVVFGDPIEALLRNPSERVTWPWFCRKWVMFTLASGNGDLQIGPIALKTGLPKWLRTRPPGMLQPYRPDPGNLDDIQGWEYRRSMGGMEILPTDDVVRLQYAPTIDPWRGIGPLTIARMAAELNYHGNQHNVSSLKKGGLPRSILTLKNQTSITPEQRALAKAEFEQMIGGPKNAGSVMLLTGDMDFKSLGWSPVDMDWLNGQKWGRDEIAVAFDWPPSYLAAQEGSSLNDSGRQADERKIYSSNLMPLGEQMEAEINIPVTRWSGGRLKFRFNWSNIEALQPQMSERVKQFQVFVTSGMSRNETVERLGLDFEDNDDTGDEVFLPSTMVTATSIVEGASSMQDTLSGLLAGPGGGAPAAPALPPGQDINLIGDGGKSKQKQLPAPDDKNANADGERLPADDEVARMIRSGAAWTSYPVTRDERRRFWRATVYGPQVRLEKQARGRIESHLQKQRGRMLKALAKTRGATWRAATTRVSKSSIDKALAAYQVGGLTQAMLPVAERCFVDGMKSARKDMSRAAASKKKRTRVSGDALQALVDQAVSDGKITASDAKGISTEQELNEVLAAGGYGPAAEGAVAGAAITNLDIPNEYAPNGTQQIKLEYFDPRTRMWTLIDEKIRDKVGESLREGYQAGETLREMKQRVIDYMEGVSDSRARTIARTEVGTMRNGGRAEYMKQQGVETIEWMSEQDDRVRESHAACDGEQVQLGEPFSNGLTWPNEMGAPPEEVCNCRCTFLPIARGLTDEQDASTADDNQDSDPEQAALAGELVVFRAPGRKPVRMLRGTIGLARAAADTEHTGAMIALVPSAEDAARLAVPGGEDPADLHVTLMYLGDASAIAADERQALLDAVRSVAMQYAPLQGKTFGFSLLNPTDKACLVLNVGGAAIDNFRAELVERLGGSVAPDAFAPWLAHMTLIYAPASADGLASDVDQLAARIGPVTFDRVRVAFGGRYYDTSLTEALDVRRLAAVCRAHGIPVVRGDISLA